MWPAAPATATEMAVPRVMDARISRALHIVEHRYAERLLTVRTVAGELGVACEYFCRLFKRSSGFSFGRALDDTRIEHARRLLRESTLSCKEIAARVGYDRTSRLDRRFRKRMGVTP